MAGYLAVLALLYGAWQTPAGKLLMSAPVLAQIGREVLALPFGKCYVVAGFTVATAFGVPVLILLPAGALVFGAWPGAAYALFGILGGAVVTWAIGRYVAAGVVERLLGSRMVLLQRHLSRRGVLTVALSRLLPVAPFLIVNLVAGALRVRLSAYLAGTWLGLLPATVGMTALVKIFQADRFQVRTVVWLVGIVVVTFLAGWLWLRHHRQASRHGAPKSPVQGEVG
ncbi:MAG: TVP38/TMEM64 family protein [Aquabacterium sp.]